eukprot:303507-Pyramimonas_sp.AAC.1
MLRRASTWQSILAVGSRVGSARSRAHLRRHPRAVALLVRRDGPVAESVAVLELAVAQVQLREADTVAQSHSRALSRCVVESPSRSAFLVPQVTTPPGA